MERRKIFVARNTYKNKLNGVKNLFSELVSVINEMNVSIKT